MKHTKKRIVVSLLTLVVSHFLLLQASSAATPLKYYRMQHVSVNYPSDWDIKKASDTENGFFVFSPRTSPTDRYRENVNITFEKAKFADLETCVRHSLEKTNIVVNNMKTTEQRKVRFMNLPALKISFSGNKGNIYLTYLRYYFIRNGQFYTLTYVAESAQFQHYLPRGTKIMESVKLY